jgi:hypothetical protein
MIGLGGMVDPAQAACVNFGASAYRAEVFLFWGCAMVFHVG